MNTYKRTFWSQCRRASTPTVLAGSIALTLLFLGSISFSKTQVGSHESQSQESQALLLKPGRRVVFAGNTFAERMNLYGYFETALHCAFPNHELVVRNLGWSGDEVDLMPRPANFGSFLEHLEWQRASVIFLCFGMNESFAGAAGLVDWEQRLGKLIQSLSKQSFDGVTPPTLILVSPIAHEDLGHPKLSGAALTQRNSELAAYTEVMRSVATQHSVRFIDLHSASGAAEDTAPPRTINGIHLNERGYYEVAQRMSQALGWHKLAANPPKTSTPPDQLRRLVIQKNHHFFLSWRPLNTYYIWGARAYCWAKDDPMRELEEIAEMVTEWDRKIWQAAKPTVAELWRSPPAGGPELWEQGYDYSRTRTPQTPAPAQLPEVRRNGVIK